jgi:hypothetical protein
VLYGIFPCVLLGAGLAYGITRWRRKPLKQLREAYQNATNQTNYRDVIRFTDPTQVIA